MTTEFTLDQTIPAEDLRNYRRDNERCLRESLVRRFALKGIYINAFMQMTVVLAIGLTLITHAALV